MQKITPFIMMSIVSLALIITIIIYFSRRFAYAFNIQSLWPLYLTFSVLTVFSFVGLISTINATSGFGHITFKVSSIVMGFMLFLLLSLILVDIINLFIKIPTNLFGVSTIVIAVLLSVIGYWNASNIRISKYDLPIKGIKKNFKVVHLSDIHIGHFRTNGYASHIAELTNHQKPDAVLITGDYLDSQYALDQKYFDPLKSIDAPIYFVDGNHDKATNNKKIERMMEKVGVHVLYNEVVMLKDIQIIGLTHMLADRKTFDIHATPDKPTIEEMLPQLNIDQNKPSVLLHHSPNGIKYADKAGIDLYLSGHTHAGQIFPFNYLNNLVFEYNRGLHNYNGTKVFVSEGVGTFGPPFRIGTKSEIVVFNLIPQS
ncbi:MAG: metallophosphoesterase [Hyphomicrobiales bacterium]